MGKELRKVENVGKEVRKEEIVEKDVRKEEQKCWNGNDGRVERTIYFF